MLTTRPHSAALNTGCISSKAIFFSQPFLSADKEEAQARLFEQAANAGIDRTY